MNNVESIEQVLFSYGNLKVKTQVNLYKRKQNERVRISNVYSSTYVTKKYLDPMQVKKIVLDIRTFLTFNYYSEDNTGSIFLTQNGIYDLRKIFRFLTAEFECISQERNYGYADSPFIIQNGSISINPDCLIELETDENRMIFLPGLAKKQNDTGEVSLFPVIKLYINNDRNKILLDERSIIHLNEILRSYDLVQQGQNLLITAKLYESDFSDIAKRPIEPTPF